MTVFSFFSYYKNITAIDNKYIFLFEIQKLFLLCGLEKNCTYNNTYIDGI